MKKPELLVIGLDCLDPFYLKKWIEEGCLPTFKRLIENGVFGKLKSTIPPTTFPAWPAIFTGKNPGKLGVFDFFNVKKVGNEFTLEHSSPAKWRKSYVWDILGAVGKKAGIINFPDLFKTYAVNGFMINTRNNLSAFPQSLEKELKTNVPDLELNNKNPFKSIANIRKYTVTEWKVNKFLRRTIGVDLLIHIFHTLDVTVHHSRNEEEIKETYIKMDEQLGEYLDSYKDQNVIIVSDHGAKRFSRKFYMNSYLKENGYLALKNVDFKKKSLQRSLPYKIVNVFPGLEHIIAKFSTIFTRLTGKNLRASLDELFDSVDWKLSKVFAYVLTNSNFIGLWLLKKDANITNKLLELRDPENKRKIVKNIYCREEIYSGPMLEVLPDLIVELDENYLATSELGPFMFCNTCAFAHQKYGTFIAYGRDFKEKASIDDAEVIDVAPTILHMMDAPINENMDGKVLIDIFKKNSKFAKKGVKREKFLHCTEDEDVELSDEEKEKVKERLKTLGYFS